MMNKLVVQPVSFQKYSNLGSIESTVMFYIPQIGEEQQLALGQARQFTQNYQQDEDKRMILSFGRGQNSLVSGHPHSCI